MDFLGEQKVHIASKLAASVFTSFNRPDADMLQKA